MTLTDSTLEQYYETILEFQEKSMQAGLLKERIDAERNTAYTELAADVRNKAGLARLQKCVKNERNVSIGVLNGLEKAHNIFFTLRASLSALTPSEEEKIAYARALSEVDEVLKSIIAYQQILAVTTRRLLDEQSFLNNPNLELFVNLLSSYQEEQTKVALYLTKTAEVSGAASLATLPPMPVSWSEAVKKTWKASSIIPKVGLGIVAANASAYAMGGSRIGATFGLIGGILTVSGWALNMMQTVEKERRIAFEKINKFPEQQILQSKEIIDELRAGRTITLLP